jgi:nucleotide-binding universal stress UspA family protein
MKNLLLLIHDDAGQEARLQAALDITRAIGGHLTCLDVAVMAPIMAEDIGLSGGVTLLEIEKATETENRARLEPRIAAEGMPYDWVDVVDYVAPALKSACRLADLIVVNRQLSELPLPDMRTLASNLVVESGKPVLAVPDGARGLDAAGAVLVAWDGSIEASAALAAAVPLMQLAGDVLILEVNDGSVTAPAEEAASYLSRHGIAATVERREMEGGRMSDMLLSYAACTRFAYVVMGAFGHSRLVEAMFGGVTRRMLTESPVPLFIAR